MPPFATPAIVAAMQRTIAACLLLALFWLLNLASATAQPSAGRTLLFGAWTPDEVGLLGPSGVTPATRKTFDPASGIQARVQSAGLELGLICRSLRDIVAICPPLIITESQIDELFDKLWQSLDLAHADARKAGLMP